MSVTITSQVPSYAGGETTTGALTIIAPNIGPGFPIAITDVIGLSAALDAKLDDVLGVLGLTNVVTTGTELNFLSGVTSAVQTQIDGKLMLTGGTLTGSLLMGVGAQIAIDAGLVGAPGLAIFGDLDTGLWSSLVDNLDFAVGGLNALNIAASGALSVPVGYEALVVADTVIPNKKYVDDAITAATSGGFLPLTGGVMSGDIDLDGVARLLLDADGNSLLEGLADDVVNLWLGGTVEFTFDTSTLDVGTKTVANVVDPVNPQEAATMNYVDTEIVALALNGTGPYLRLSGADTLVGDLEVGGNQVNLDANSDTFIESAADDLMQFWVGSILTLAMDGLTIDAQTQRITDVVDPTAAQDAATMNYVDTEILALGLGGATGPFLELAGGTMAGGVDMDSNTLINLVNPTNPQDAATMDYVDTEIVALGLGGVTGPFLRLSGADTMAGDLDMGGNLISDLGAAVAATDALPLGQADSLYIPIAGGVPATGDLDMGGFKVVAMAGPAAGTDAANKDYVDTEVAGVISGAGGPFLPLTGGTLTGDVVTAAGIVFQADPGLATAPPFTFTGQLDAGLYADGTNIHLALDGVDAITVTPSAGTNEVSVNSRRVTDVDTPIAGTDAVNIDYVDSLNMVKLLGSVSGVDLLSTGATPIYTLPAGKMHIITHFIVRATSYTPGASPTNPEVSFGQSTGSGNQFSGPNTVLDWGGTAGAGDQAVYVIPVNGSPTPNSADTIRIRVDTAAAGTFSALTVTVYAIGLEL